MFNKQMKKMDCAEVFRKLSPFQDNELEAEVHARVKEHLSGCEGCKKEFEELIKINEILLSADNVESSENFDAEVMAGINRYREKRHSGKFAFAYSFIFALFFVFGVFLDPFFSGSIPEPEIIPELSSVLLEGQKFISEDNLNSVIIQLAGGINEKRDN